MYWALSASDLRARESAKKNTFRISCHEAKPSARLEETVHHSVERVRDRRVAMASNDLRSRARNMLREPSPMLDPHEVVELAMTDRHRDLYVADLEPPRPRQRHRVVDPSIHA